MESKRESEEPPITDELIEDLWAALTRGIWHGMSCRCCGGGPLFLDHRSFEEDLREYLLDKYESEGAAPLKEILLQREQDCGVGFAAWLSRLGADGAVPAPLVDRLRRDVVSALKNMQPPQSFGYKG
jgi:hypothetical protein